MDEREHHDAFYAAEASGMFGRPIFQALRGRVLDFLRLSLGPAPGARILSLGSGDGEYELLAAPHARRVLGIELSPVAVAQARRRAAAAGFHHVEFRTGDVRDVAAIAGEERFDVVWALALLHHLAPGDQARVLRAAAQVLVPGGLFLCVDPNRGRLVDLLKPLVRGKLARYHSPDEEEIDPAELVRVAEQNGLEALEVGYTDFFLGPLAWVAPRTPGWLVPPLVAADALLLRVPGLRTKASGCGVVMRRP